MKKLILLFTVTLLMSSCYTRMGTLTVISTRNFESNEKYVPLSRFITAKAKTKRGEALQQAIDNAIKKTPGGEFMKNTVIYVKNNGKKIKVTGDVWGLPVTTPTATH